ncbi:cell division protein ZapE [Deinococcus pimensis]|uniref:cell division protein ZapE n=1 Tax=Deinococcus pimensis TaxID=309888 RepID=UPI0004AE938F|nr:cell division protein ZapE [Deinococcus pimensis]
MIDLTRRHPTVTPQDLLASFVPSPRFADVSFANYLPNPDFPSQEAARTALAAFAERASRPVPKLRLFTRGKPQGEGWYLDGGFGVGKTHLLASTFYAFRGGPKAFLSFQELLYTIGALGMVEAARAFSGYRLLAVDEFELDDPGNTHMLNTFLAQVMPGGTHVVTTSNTEPGALGQGRFNASDFQRQITAIADRFSTLRVDGPDFRARGSAPAAPLTPEEFAAWRAAQPEATLADLEHRALNRHLLNVHPARFGKLLAGVRAVGVRDVTPMEDQNVALRFVHFVDKAYDLGVSVAVTGAPLGTLFPDTYRHGAYAKKYSRCLSRLSELQREARQAAPAGLPTD